MKTNQSTTREPNYMTIREYNNLLKSDKDWWAFIEGMSAAVDGRADIGELDRLQIMYTNIHDRLFG